MLDSQDPCDPQLMRRILIDHARGHLRRKRGGEQKKVALEEAFIFSPQQSAELLAVDESLERLARLDARFHSTRLAGAGFPKSEAGVEDKLEPPEETHQNKAKQTNADNTEDGTKPRSHLPIACATARDSSSPSIEGGL